MAEERRAEEPQAEKAPAASPPKKKKKRSKLGLLFLLILLGLGAAAGLHFSGLWDGRPLLWSVVPQIPYVGQDLARLLAVPERYALTADERRRLELEDWQKRLDEKERGVLDKLLRRDVARIEESVHSIVRSYDSLLDYLTTLDVQPPRLIASAAEAALTSNITHALERDTLNIAHIRSQLQLAARWQIAPDAARIGFALAEWLNRRMERLCGDPRDAAAMDEIGDLLALFLDEFSWRLSLYQAQNLYHEILTRHRPSAASPELKDALYRLGSRLRFSETMLKF